MKNNQLLKQVVQIVEKRNKIMSQGLWNNIVSLIEAGAKCEVTDKLAEAVFCFKFRNSCVYAKTKRAGIKAGYEGIEYKLGKYSLAPTKLKQLKPKVYEEGIRIVKTYLEKSMAQGKITDKDAPVMHRLNDKCHYEWSNINVMSRKEHDELTSFPMLLTYFDKDDQHFVVRNFKSIRSLANELNQNRSNITNYEGTIASDPVSKERFMWQRNKKQRVQLTKKDFMKKLRHYEELLDNYGKKEGLQHYVKSIRMFYENWMEIGIKKGFIKKE